MGLEFVEDLIPEYLILVLAIFTLLICLYSAFKARDLPAVGYIIPISYIIWVYSYFAVGDPPLIEREFFARLGFIVLLIDISIWRIVEIISNSKRNGNKLPSLSFIEIKNYFLNLFRRGK